MAVFTYKAVNGLGISNHGMIAADTPRQARDQLRQQGLSVEHVELCQPPKTNRFSWQFSWPGANANKLAATVREMATLLAVGIPVTETLDTLVRQHRGGFRKALMQVRDRVSGGIGLAAAMGEQPAIFDSLCVAMVEVGENSGNLEAVLNQLADFRERSLELKDRVVTVLLYPCIVLAASLSVALFLMTVVIPMLLTNLLDAGRELPWPTRVLKGCSDFLLDYGWMLAILAGLIAISIIAGLRTRVGQRAWHRSLLRIPLIGSMAQKQAIARIALVMSTLIRSGVVYLTALEIACRSTRNVVIREALEQSGRDVGAGHDLGIALERTAVFPPLVIHIFSIGQKSGRLDELLERLAENYDRQVTSISSRLASALEPVLILVLAVFVGFILFATMLPILEAGNVL